MLSTRIKLLQVHFGLWVWGDDQSDFVSWVAGDGDAAGGTEAVDAVQQE